MKAASKYQIDLLGWLQFEQLCTRLLEFEGVSSTGWTGSADKRRDTNFTHDLSLDALDLPLKGPVYVSVAWIRTWHRAASVLESLRDAIEERAREGQPPASLLVLTNAGPEHLNRRLAAQALDGAIEPQNIAVAGPAELSLELDARPELRRRMPATLGIRDLEELIDDATRDASSFDLLASEELARVFVATSPYLRALGVLERYSFVVLTGPPEMGKTAIARTVGLAQLTAGWAVHECTDPDEVFRGYDRDLKQVFVADDAFGSTEYRPDSAERWARDLHRVLSHMDERHWLIWTSRPAPLRAGLRRVHRERGLERFPSPSDVQVDAGELDRFEKALILFRHAKAANLPHPAIVFVQEQGPEIVAHPYFTPERIRRFVATGLPRVSVPSAGGALAYDELRQPTEAMAASLRALESEHRDLLVAMLDAPGNSVSQRELAAALRRHHDGGLSRPPAELFDGLADHFLRVSDVAVMWIHPSWRDLVIDDLAVDCDRRSRFLSRCGLDGLLVAISTSGGAKGAREFPLLPEDADWDTAVDRVWKLVRQLEDPDLARLLWSLGEAVESAKEESQRREAEGLARTALEISLRRFGDEPISLDLLDPWFDLASRLEDRPPSPWLATTWAELLPSMPFRIDSVADLARVDEWLRVAEHLVRHDPEQLASFGFPDRYMPIIEALVPAVHAASLTTAENRALLVRVLERVLHLVPGWSSPLGSEWLGLREAEIAEHRPQPSWGTSELRDPGLSVARILRDL